MIKKPEILKGGVKEFIDLPIELSFVKRVNQTKSELYKNGEYDVSTFKHNQLKLFYLQPFQPEMIVEYFKGINRHNEMLLRNSLMEKITLSQMITWVKIVLPQLKLEWK